MINQIKTLLSAIPSGHKAAASALDLLTKERKALLRRVDNLEKALAGAKESETRTRSELEAARSVIKDHDESNAGTNTLAGLSSEMVRRTVEFIVQNDHRGTGVAESQIISHLGGIHRAKLDLALEELKAANLITLSSCLPRTALRSFSETFWVATSDGKRAIVEAGLVE